MQEKLLKIYDTFRQVIWGGAFCVGIYSFFIALVLFAGLNASEKIYIDADDLNTTQDSFHIHIGDNIWMETNTVHRDATGLYTFESCITQSMNGKAQRPEYVKKWKCPYCYRYWPMGSSCKNPDCPSKYK